MHYISYTSYLSIALSKILSHSKIIKNIKKLSVFGKNNSCCLSSFLQTHIFWNFDHISRIFNQINYWNIWFPKVMIILIMAAQVLFFNVFPKNTRTLMALRNVWVTVYEVSGSGFEFSCTHLNFRFCACFEQGVPWHSYNYRIWIHSETRTWHDKNIQWIAPYR